MGRVEKSNWSGSYDMRGAVLLSDGTLHVYCCMYMWMGVMVRMMGRNPQRTERSSLPASHVDPSLACREATLVMCMLAALAKRGKWNGWGWISPLPSNRLGAIRVYRGETWRI
jgi:hypothetical protein